MDSPTCTASLFGLLYMSGTPYALVQIATSVCYESVD